MVDDIKEYAESYYTDREFAEKSGKYATAAPLPRKACSTVKFLKSITPARQR